VDEIKQWEYRVQTFGSSLRGPKDEDLEAALNEWGDEGWEVVAVQSVESSHKMVVVAKRPLTAAARRSRTLPGGPF
jgi:hypothetical protein